MTVLKSSRALRNPSLTKQSVEPHEVRLQKKSPNNQTSINDQVVEVHKAVIKYD